MDQESVTGLPSWRLRVDTPQRVSIDVMRSREANYVELCARNETEHFHSVSIGRAALARKLWLVKNVPQCNFGFSLGYSCWYSY